MPRPATDSRPVTLKIPQDQLELVRRETEPGMHYTDTIREAVRQFLRGRGHQLEHTAWLWYRWKRDLVCPPIGVPLADFTVEAVPTGPEHLAPFRITKVRVA